MNVVLYYFVRISIMVVVEETVLSLCATYVALPGENMLHLVSPKENMRR